MIALVLAILLLGLGPVFGDRLSAGRLRAGADGFVLVTVIGLILLSLLPDAVSHAGLWALLMSFAAFGLPWLAEQQWAKFEVTAHRALLLVAGSSLALHGAADGAVLKFASNLDAKGHVITVGLLMHRAGAALALWWLMISTLGRPLSLLVLAAFAASTMSGWWIAGLADDLNHGLGAGLWQAAAAGSLLHVVLHPLGHTALETPGGRSAHRVGTALGLLVIAGLSASHTALEHDAHDAHSISAYFEIGLSLAPYMLVLTMLTGAVGMIWRLSEGGTPNRAVRFGLKSGITVSGILWLLAASVPRSMIISIFGNSAEHQSLSAYLFGFWIALAVLAILREGARGFIGLRTRAHRCGHAGTEFPPATTN